MSALLVLSTASTISEAKKIAQTLVAERLAACVNRIPNVESRYWWKGKICVDREVLLLIKTTTAHLAAVTRRIQALHSYEVPEVLALPVTGGSAAYLAWLHASTTHRQKKSPKRHKK